MATAVDASAASASEQPANITRSVSDVWTPSESASCVTPYSDASSQTLTGPPSHHCSRHHSRFPLARAALSRGLVGQAPISSPAP